MKEIKPYTEEEMKRLRKMASASLLHRAKGVIRATPISESSSLQKCSL